MPLLALWFGKLFASTVAFFAAFMSKQIAVRVAAISALVTVTSVFVLSIESMIQSISVSVPVELTIAATWVWPSNGTACISVILAAHAARWVYDWNTRVIQMRMF